MLWHSEPMIDALDALMEAKAAREVVRDTVLKSLRRGADVLEIAGLLKADELATTNLKIAQEAFDRMQVPINDFTRNTMEPQT